MPAITGSNALGATACGRVVTGVAGFGTGNLNLFVTGGAPPYAFTVTGAVDGSVSVAADGVYTFTPNVAGPATGSFQYVASDVAGCTSTVGTVTVPIVPSPILPEYPTIDWGRAKFYLCLRHQALLYSAN